MAVYISHRLASTRFCDRIIYIEDGAIAEQGSHDALIAMGGKYTKLFAVQSKYYQEGAEF
jgi:ATP-binding cassette subfamily B protein